MTPGCQSGSKGNVDAGCWDPQRLELPRPRLSHPHPHPDPLVPRFPSSPELCCFLGRLVSGIHSNNLPLHTLSTFWSQENKRAPGLPTLGRIQPTPGLGKGADKRAFLQGAPANKAGFQGCLLVFMFPWVLQWEEQARRSEKEMRKVIISSGGPPGLGWVRGALRLLDGSSWILILHSQRKP